MLFFLVYLDCDFPLNDLGCSMPHSRLNSFVRLLRLLSISCRNLNHRQLFWELFNCRSNFGMGDAESLQPSKKRAAVKELSRDNPGLDDDNESSEQENGTFKRASDEVMANRRIVKVRKTTSTTTTASNPFAVIQLVPPANTSTNAVTTTEAGNGTTSKKPEDSNDQGEAIQKEETNVSKEADHEKERDENSKLPESKFESTADVDKEKVDNPNEPNKLESTEKKAMGSEKIKDDTKTGTVVEKSADGIEVEGNKTQNEMEKHVGDGKYEKDAETTSFSSFQQLSSSQNAFTGLAGTGFSNTTFSFGASSKEGSPLGFGSESGAGSGFGSGSLFGVKNDRSFFGLSLPTNGNASLFGNSGSSSIKKSEGTGFPSLQEVPIVTGEEHEKSIFTADSVLFEYLNGGWRERGKGELKLNISSGTGKARLVMRTRGNYRLILNASLYPEMKLASMDKKGVTFACMNSADDGKDGLSTIALKFKDASIVEEFRAAVTENKDKIEGSLKAPPNSP